RVDQEEEVALLDDRAVLEVDRLEVPAHPWAHLDRIDGVETGGVLVPLGDLSCDRLDDLHLRRRRCGRRPRAARRQHERGGERYPPRASERIILRRTRHLIRPGEARSSPPPTAVTSGVSSSAIDGGS